MDIKPRPNQHRYIEILRSMTPEQKVLKVFELNALGKELCLTGLRMRHPGMDEKELHRLYLKTKVAAARNNLRTFNASSR
jgi:hypothetical protein